jgi:hypothetical protein
MSIFKKIKSFFNNTDHAIPSQSSSDEEEEYIAKHLNEIELESLKFTQRYGNNFEAFFYRPDFAQFLRKDVLEFRNPNYEHNNFLDNNHWEMKHPFNFPGAFYSGESDTCGTGIREAPNNVVNDRYALEFIFKQPRTFMEFLCVLDAAAVEVLDSYSCNGNDHWTYEKCKDWWKSKPILLGEFKKNAKGKKYVEYLNSSAESDLRHYCYFLDNGFYPQNKKINLPSL